MTHTKRKRYNNEGHERLQEHFDCECPSIEDSLGQSDHKKRHNALLTSIKANMNDQVRIIGSGSGLHVLLEPKNNMTEKELIATAKEKGVLVYPVSSFYERPPSQEYSQVLLGFAGLDENRIHEGFHLLSKAWF